MLSLFLKISAAFGLSSAAGLNAYIPLLLVSILANRGFIHLAPAYQPLASPWILALLVVLCLIELVVDKIPGVDHINDLIQTLIRPAAGALLFAAQTGTISYIHPSLFIILGLLTAGAVHVSKSLARPAINLTTFGIGAPVVSSLENLISTTLSLVALLVPILTLFLMAFLAWFLYKSFKNFTRKSRPIKIHAEPVLNPIPAAAQNTLESP